MYTVHRNSIPSSALKKALILGLVLLGAGCRSESQPEPKNDSSSDSQTDVKPPGDKSTGPAKDGKQGQDKVADADNKSRIAIELMGDKLELYEKLTKRYERVIGKSIFEEQKPHIEALEKKLAKLDEDYQALSPEMKRAAEKVYGKEVQATRSKYNKAKEKAIKMMAFPRQKEKEKEKL